MFQENDETNDELPTASDQLQTLNNITSALNRRSISILEQVDTAIEALTREHRGCIIDLREQDVRSNRANEIRSRTDVIQRRAFSLVEILTTALIAVDQVRLDHLQEQAPQERDGNDKDSNDPEELSHDAENSERGTNKNIQEAQEQETHPVVHVIYGDQIPVERKFPQRSYRNPQDIVIEDTDSDSLPTLETHHSTDSNIW